MGHNLRYDYVENMVMFIENFKKIENIYIYHKISETPFSRGMKIEKSNSGIRI